ncbi:MAG: hypothetical protein KY468_21305, partial [Armatimonadetes bacterium]|nr:hypothetical protein [Armatimonadota bacterium]
MTDMTEARYAPTTTVLPKEVTSFGEDVALVVGGYNGSRTLATAQIFRPSTGAMTSTGSLSMGRNFATATLLNNGKVLIAGGYREDSSGAGSLASAEIYDPATGLFSKNAYAMTTSRELYTATRLPDGRVLLVGGFKTGFRGGTLRSAEIYNPATGQFTATGSMQTPYGRFGHDAIPLDLTADGMENATHVLIVGGKERRSSSDWRSLNTAELYDIAKGTFAYTSGSMQYTRDRVTVAWITAAKKALVIGGKAEALGVSDDVLVTEWYDPATQTFSPGPSLAQGRMAHTLTKFTDSKGWENILVAGGWSVRADSTISSTELLVVDPGKPLAGSFVSAGSLAHTGHDHGAAYLSGTGGGVLVFGGKRHEWDPVLAYHVTEWLDQVERYTPAIIHDVAVTSITPDPATVTSGSLAALYVGVKNEGSAEETFTVSLANTTTEVTPGSLINNDQSIVLSPGASRTLRFDWDTNGASLGSHVWTATAATVAGETDTADNQKATDPAVQVVAPVHDVAVTAVSVADPVARSLDSVPVAVEVANPGDYPETFTVTLTDTPEGSTTGTLVGSQTVTLEAGTTRTLSFGWTTSGADLGVHQLAATAKIDDTAISDANGANDSAAMTTNVVDPFHDVAVAAVSAPATVDQGSVVPVSVSVENRGTYSETFTVTLTDTPEGSAGTLVGSRS